MTTATSPHLAGPGTDLCRITVIGPAGRVDLAIPAGTTMAQLLPVLLIHVVAESERAQPWVLQRLGAEPLSRTGLIAAKTVTVICVELTCLRYSSARFGARNAR